MATIKPDPDAPVATPTPMDEDDLYEDAGDLEFFDPVAHNNAYGAVYLARIPRYLWEAWSNIDDKEEIQIGTIRYWHEGTQPRMQMLLADHPQHRPLPKEYSLDVQASDVNNTFVFSEEDLPSFKNKNKARAEAIKAGIPASLLKPKSEKVEKPKFDKRARYQPFYRKAIPKKTKIFGKVKYEVTTKPLDNAESDALLRKRNEEAMKPKRTVGVISMTQAARALHPGSNRANDWGEKFINTAPKPAKTKKSEQFKAARIPKAQLLDQIFACFREFQYWPLRALRQRLQQPEIYLRQTMEEIGVLNKTGRFANLWSLKPECAVEFTDNTAEIAPEAVEDSDAEEEMEDVVPSASG